MVYDYLHNLLHNYGIMENGKLLSINFLWTGWAYGMISENLTLTLGIIGGITLIWLNVEGIITHRKNRK